MKFLLLIPIILCTFPNAFAEGNKKYKKEDFEKIKNLKIEYLNKKINCIQVSNDFREMKKSWPKKNRY